uniref:ATP synthase F0 subunit 8 n=1 Tax=Tricentrus sp. EMHAU-15062504 TaxID=2040485 RepID=A0A343KJ73_9HEMI|nr:ATP synthase F0 subunit 8 [Tricentrus sp. EMHAU-15062504]
MPQMSPMWWMTLMLMFNFMVMLSISMTYFNYKVSIVMMTKINKMNLNWKW